MLFKVLHALLYCIAVVIDEFRFCFGKACVELNSLLNERTYVCFVVIGNKSFGAIYCDVGQSKHMYLFDCIALCDRL